MSDRCSIEGIYAIQRQRFIYGISALAFLNLLVFGLLNLLHGHPVPGLAEIGAGLALVTNLVLYRRRHHYVRAANLLILTASGVLFFLLFQGGIDGSGYLWFFGLPIAVFFLKGLKGGGVIMAGLFALFLGLLFFQAAGWVETAYTTLQLRQFFVAMLTVTLLATLYEQARNRYEREVNRKADQLEEMNRKLETMAATDVLTGIANRRRFDDALEAEVQRALRHGDPFALILFDIDHFKQVNDTYGHKTGDLVLQQVTALVQENIRALDLFARIGGEEFAVLVPGGSKEEAAALAEKLRVIIGQGRLEEVRYVTASFGVTAYCGPEDGDDVLRRADEALYEAKGAGRNRVVGRSRPPEEEIGVLGA